MASPPEQVWFRRVRVLWEHPTRFFPTRDMTVAEQINAIVRFVLYATVLLYAYNRSDRILGLGLALIALVSYGYNGVALDGAGRPKLRSLAPGACRKPTKTNPFMNRLPYDDPKEPPPCDAEDVKEAIQENFYRGLPRQLEDVYDKNSSFRQFMPMPNGGQPPDSMEFAKYLYGDVRNCKTFASDCPSR